MGIPEIIAAILAGVQMAPQVVGLGLAAKEYFAHLFEAGLITKEEQDKHSAEVDAICQAADNDTPPPALVVEPDPPTDIASAPDLPRNVGPSAPNPS